MVKEHNKHVLSLFSNEGTVKNHMSSILSKLGARDRIHAVLKARELGLA